MNIIILLLIGINCYVYYNIYNGKLDLDDLGSSYLYVFVRRDYKRLLTSAFAHMSPLHLMFNMYSLYNIGNVITRLFGTIHFLIIFFVTMILGQLFALYLRHSNSDDYTMSVGASGAIFGLFGVYFMTIIRIFGIAGIGSITPTIVSMVILSFMPGIDSKAHICSLAVGVVLGYLMLML